MIAEEHPAARQGLRAMLQSEQDIEIVAEAADGHRALVAVVENRPDVVLMDIHMPRLDGVEATRAIKAQWPATRVLLMITLRATGVLRRAIQAGADGCLSKDASSCWSTPCVLSTQGHS